MVSVIFLNIFVKKLSFISLYIFVICSEIQRIILKNINSKLITRESIFISIQGKALSV